LKIIPEDALGPFLELLRPSTKRMYATALRCYLSALGCQDAGVYLEELRAGKRSAQQDLTAYFSGPGQSLAPKTRQGRISVLRQFYQYHEVPAPPQLWKRLRGRGRGTRPLTMDQPPTPAELRMILTHARLPYRAIYLVLATSGLRVGELQQLTLRDVDLSKDPAVIKVRGETSKTGNSRVTFMNGEAKEAVLEWLKVREAFMRALEVKHYKKGKASLADSLFLVTYGPMNVAWRLALRKSNLSERDPQTEIHVRHVHTLRKFFRTRLGAVIPQDVVEALMGHEEGIQAFYKRYTAEDLARFYSQGAVALEISGKGEEVARLQKELDEGQRKLEQIVVDQASRLQKMEEQMENICRTVVFKGSRGKGTTMERQ